MPKETHKINPFHIRAAIEPNSYNEETRTLEVVASTGMAGLRMGWDGPFYEELSIDESHIRLERINSGGPLLNSHGSYDLSQVIGKVERAWVAKKELRATVRLSGREDVAGIVQDIRDGIITNLSVRYRTYKVEKIPAKKEGDPPTLRAIDWEPYEISFVPVPFDYKSTVRSDEQENEVQILFNNKNESKMTEEEKRAAAAQAEADKKRAADEAAAEASKVAAQKAAEEAATAERKRTSEILSAVRSAKLGEEFAQGLIEKGTSVEEARKLIIEEWAKKGDDHQANGANRSATVGKEHSEKVREGLSLALAHRVGAEKELKEAAREFRGMSLLRMAEEVLSASGENTRGMSQREIAQAALNIGTRGYHSTSDFPIILGETVNKVLRAEYELAPRTFQPICRATTASDFKTKNIMQLSGIVGSFDKVAEGGEYKAGTMTEAKESYKVEKYGKLITITWEALINDDLSAFTRIPRAIAAKAAQKQSDIVWGIITTNAALADGVALFHGTHGNLANPATAITAEALGKARAAMRKQKDLAGDYINVTPSFLVVGPDKEAEALQLLSGVYMPTDPGKKPLPWMTNLQVIVEPRLTGNQWYLAAAPSMIDTIEYAFLEGEGELFTEQRTGFDVDGLEIKARMVFGAKAIDYRGLYKNAGA